MRRAVVPVLALTTVLATALTACGSGAEPAPVTGVDTLEIPTPDPDPADYVEDVDNPWLALEVGSAATYLPDTGTLTATVSRLEVSVEEGPVVAGVRTTAVRRSLTPTEASVAEDDPALGSQLALADVVDLYAQDRSGNVWWFGREGEWLAGEDGAEAGLAMPAVPRRGDGYREALGPALDVRSRIVAVDDEATVPAGAFRDVLVVETRDGEGVVRYSYAEGTGLVEVETTEGAPNVTLGLAELR